MLFPSWDEFILTVSKFQHEINNVINKRITNFKDNHPLSDKSIKTAIRFLPSPFDAIAETIYETSNGSEEERIGKVKEYFDDIQRLGKEHYHKVKSQLDDIGKENY